MHSGVMRVSSSCARRQDLRPRQQKLLSLKWKIGGKDAEEAKVEAKEEAKAPDKVELTGGSNNADSVLSRRRQAEVRGRIPRRFGDFTAFFQKIVYWSKFLQNTRFKWLEKVY